MKTLTLKCKSKTNATLVSNDFIDHFMAGANGEFVKVYLFLLRHMADTCTTFSVSQIADCLNHTESDVLRTFRYWEGQGLLLLDTDAEGNITSVCIERASAMSAEPASQKVQKADTPSVKPDKVFEDTPAHPKAIPLDSFRLQKEQKDLKNLYMIAEQYLGKTLSVPDIESITYFYRELHLSADVIEYLLASCVESGHKSLHYIKAVAIAWSEAGISTVEEARQTSSVYHKNCYTVLNAFGIKGRSPAPAELAYIKKWADEYGFSSNIIEEACNRTIAVTHQPRFEYADKILKKWLDNNIRHLSDIEKLDQAFRQEKSSRQSGSQQSQPVRPIKTPPRNTNNFEPRSYDMESLEAQLLKSN